MKKHFASKVVVMLTAICMLVSSFATTTVFAAETTTPSVSYEAAENTRDSFGGKTIPYGTTIDYVMNKTFTDSTVLTVLRADTDDLRVHRLILKFHFKRASIDTGINPVKLTVELTRSDGYTKTYVSDETNYGEAEFVIDDFPVSYGGIVSVWVDASTADGYATNSNYRSITITESWAYCD